MKIKNLISSVISLSSRCHQGMRRGHITNKWNLTFCRKRDRIVVMNWETLIVKNHDTWKKMVEDESAVWIGVQQSLLDDEPLVMFRAKGAYQMSGIPITEMSLEKVRSVISNV